MELYYKCINGEVLEVNDIEFKGSTDKVEVENLSQFIHEIKCSISEEIENKVLRLLDENSEESDTESQKFNIKHWVSNRSFGEIIDMYLSGEILKPNMQREFVWDSIKCSRLIESIILGLPIPPFFLLEIEKNKYEIIDGFQRITTLVNFVNGLPWNFNVNEYVDENDCVEIDIIKNLPGIRASKLSKNVISDITNSTFANLDKDFQRMIKRSTIPLIEFNQVSPDNFDSKYLIFERINTGSEKLNPMQIRKSLAYGTFIEDLYTQSNKIEDFKSLFSVRSIKKDAHVEAYLRTYVMSKIYKGEFSPQKSGIKNILNEYCERNRTNNIDDEFLEEFNQAYEYIYSAFKKIKTSMFKRVEVFGENEFKGNLNISILESFIGGLILKLRENPEYEVKDSLEIDYQQKMIEVAEKSILDGYTDPFTSSTGTIENIKRRFEIIEEILGE